MRQYRGKDNMVPLQVRNGETILLNNHALPSAMTGRLLLLFVS